MDKYMCAQKLSGARMDAQKGMMDMVQSKITWAEAYKVVLTKKTKWSHMLENGQPFFNKQLKGKGHK
ncbi:unnamed protein product [Prunus armeniaca]|uniref:Uncharacterized protein n=1 Tax=Prunus armeniaca TaxID=36596 RepID=A0A6J5VMT2_PRUAR|nr:unnamed protein product [Prunus armeniaca]